MRFTEEEYRESIKRANYFEQGSAISTICENVGLSPKQRRGVSAAIKQAYYEGFLSGMERERNN